jgi:hypothetical protein
MYFLRLATPFRKGRQTLDFRRPTECGYQRLSPNLNAKYVCRLLFVGSLLFSFAISLHSEVIDRIVALVDGHIITLSDLRKEREIRAKLNETAIDDDKALTDELIDEYVIEQQIAEYPNIDVSDEEIDQALRTLSTNGASVEIPAAMQRRIRAQKFFALKFGASIQPTEEQVQKYYSEVFLPAAQAKGLNPIPALTDSAMASAIRDNIIQETLDGEVKTWLEAIRKRSIIEVFE